MPLGGKGVSVQNEKSPCRQISALWACSNAVSNRALFSKISPGEFSKASAMQRGCHFGGTPYTLFMSESQLMYHFRVENYPKTAKRNALFE